MLKYMFLDAKVRGKKTPFFFLPCFVALPGFVLLVPALENQS